jgi:hypothetical protein
MPAPKGHPRVTRRIAGGVPLLTAAILGGACGTDPSTPTSPTETAPPIWAALSCAPPAGVHVHRVPLAGVAAPFQVWVDGTSPPEGAEVRAGDRFEVRYRYAGPSGFTVTSRVDVGVLSDPRGFRAVFFGGCGASVSLGSIPHATEPLRLHVRVWVVPGVVPPADIPGLFDRPPDYEASEPLPWTVMR